MCLQKSIYQREAVFLLHDANTAKNPDFPYWKYDRFNLDEVGNDQCKAKFRFYKNDTFKLAEYLIL